MSVGALEKLIFMIGVKDMVSQPVRSINKSISGMKENATAGFSAIHGGAIGLAASGFAIKTFMEPVYDMQEALGEVRSLDVAETEMNKLTKASLKYSTKFGESASEFVRSSYDIQSAISGLADGELAKFTTASNILAKGTKADAATITNYMGTMYGIFSEQADRMGKAKWVEQLTGQTATAVQMFKTDGQNMSAAFTSVGANATASGIALNEQMGVLGTLQSTMSGSEAGTKYKAFLAGVAGAQDKLGLTFTDSQGRMLPMVDILNRIKGKFGETMSEAESLELKKAFGSDESVGLVKLLMTQTDGLSKSIETLGKVTGMSKAEQMAAKMIDPWDRFKAVTEAVRISFGNALLPTINHLLSVFSDGLGVVTSWTQEFPNITRWVGYLTLGILTLSAGTSLFTMLLGVGKVAMAGWGAGVLLMKGIMLGLSGALKVLQISWLLLNIAMYMNPVGVVIAGIVALVAIVGYFTGVWSDLYNAFADTTFGKAILEWVDKISSGLKDLGKWLGILDDDQDVNLTATSKQEVLSTYQTNGAAAPDASVHKSFTNFKTFEEHTSLKEFSIHEKEQITQLTDMNKPDPSVDKGITEKLAALMKENTGSKFGDVHLQVESMSPEQLEQWQALQG